MRLDLPDQVQYIDLRDVLTISAGWSMTLAGGFLPLPDLVVITMRDRSEHQFSVGLFGVLFGHRAYWISNLNRALTRLRHGTGVSVSLAQLSNGVSERTHLPSEALANRT
jgi:hypothetical protein